jgi:hypothetical protein
LTLIDQMGLKVYVCFSSLQQWLWSASFEEREGSIGFRQKGVLHSKRMRVCEVRSPQSRGNVPPASALTVVCPVLVRLLKNRSTHLNKNQFMRKKRTGRHLALQNPSIGIKNLARVTCATRPQPKPIPCHGRNEHGRDTERKVDPLSLALPRQTSIEEKTCRARQVSD